MTKTVESQPFDIAQLLLNPALRLTPEAKRVLTAAANAEQRSMSEFVLDSALGRADEVLAGRCVFHLASEQREAFSAALEAPVRDMPRMRELLNKPGIFSGSESE